MLDATGNASLGSNYEEVLPKVKAYHDSIGVPFGHWQFDSWFYPKDGGVNAGGGGGAVTNWTAMPSVFPSGMAAINEKLGGMPTVMHNRQWSDKSDYIHNWTNIPWYEDKYAIPMDPTQFFTKFFTQQEGWGLTMCESCTHPDTDVLLLTMVSPFQMPLRPRIVRMLPSTDEQVRSHCTPQLHAEKANCVFPSVHSLGLDV